MKPFEKHKEDLLILDNMGDFGFSSHANSARRFLAGRSDNTKAASIDQFIADKIGGTDAGCTAEDAQTAAALELRSVWEAATGQYRDVLAQTRLSDLTERYHDRGQAMFYI
jgi:hypothetical protein